MPERPPLLGPRVASSSPSQCRQSRRQPALIAQALLGLGMLSRSTAADVATVVLTNRGADALRIRRPTALEVPAGGTWSGALPSSPAGSTAGGLTVQTAAGEVTLGIPRGSYAAVVVSPGGDAAVHDTNAVQLELSRAAHVCSGMEDEEAFSDCVAANTFGGWPRDVADGAFRRLWESRAYWHLCEAAEATPALRSMELRSGHVAEVVRESPLVATVRGFLNGSVCAELMGLLGKDDLKEAHIGSGGGATSTSEHRETLTSNMFVDWDSDGLLTRTSVRMFDVASELYGEQIPYEGQEPVNYLHYLRGFEYKPHQDGGHKGTGKRVATTLIYCEAPTKGGATVFPVPDPQQVRFVPGEGDLLFFKYSPNPQDALHAACPVSEGSKSTLTQWYRMGVSPERPWDRFEDWGSFHNPHGTSRWKGKRYATQPSDEL